ncbi:metallophosphoesterase [Humisphaera borealis]|uniref:Metallophosphoesterase n=1 Tax=Humisphaera borealis TaxID=2807512 RepID=A0A7M2WRW2_9BACT|nr:metallophosphoesterase [Humisphaera borealis]QOV88258.1 metallophosphoesterase [Humisphaera borealis]
MRGYRPRFGIIHTVVLFALVCVVGGPGIAIGQTVLALPYVQPGNTPGPDGLDAKIIAWVTDATPGAFTVDYGWDGNPAKQALPSHVAIDIKAYTPPAKAGTMPATAPIKAPSAPKPAAADDDDDHGPLKAAPKTPAQHYLKYIALLPDLPADTSVWYRVRSKDALIREATFRTRSSSNKTIRFVAVGDLANGKEGQDAIAFQIAQARPDFLIALGDIVYRAGRASEYMDHFWRTYSNGSGKDARSGTSIMATTPFHVLLGNHDADTSLSVYPDALAAYYFFHAPQNGPGLGKWNTPLGRDAADSSAFRAAVGDSYPSLGFYSFDNGPAHFLVIDNNGYSKLDDPKLLQWIESDLAKSQAKWKFVNCHAPGFHSSPQHYSEQKMRSLAPIFERNGVDVVFAGHVHNYQRSYPLRFAPLPSKAGERLVNGTFTINRTFDGKSNTRAKGIVYIVSGGGGGTLYKDPLEKAAKLLGDKYKDNYAPFTATHVADRHSFVQCELSPDRLSLRAIDADGKEIESVVLTKP